jgi:hypothetical protein
VTPSTLTQTPGDEPFGVADGDGDGLGGLPEGPGAGLDDEVGVGAPDGGGCVGDVPEDGEVPGVGTGTGVPDVCGFGGLGLGLRPPGPTGTDPGPEAVDRAPGPLACPGPGGLPGCSAVPGPAAWPGAAPGRITVIAITLATAATAAVSSTQ